jgi:diguanylate cyclase
MQKANAKPNQSQREQQRRLTVLKVSMVSYALDTIWLSLFAILGVVDFCIPIWYTILAVLGVGMTWFVFARGWNLGFADPTLTIAQLCLGFGSQIVFLILAPQLGLMFLTTIFIVLAFGALTMSVRQFVWAWLVVGMLVGLVIVLMGDQLSIPVSNLAERAVVWLALFSTLGRVIYLDLFVGQLQQRLRQRNQELQVSLERIEKLASVDELTQTWNRRTFLQFVENETMRMTRSGGVYCLAILDIDHFKSVNDVHGHLLGDDVLKCFAQTVSNALRGTDTIGRYGGEEFMVLLPDTPLEGGLLAAERIRLLVEQTDWEQIAPGLKVTVSIGITASSPGCLVTELLGRSDTALYEAKRAGRNQTVIAQSLGQPTSPP